MASRALLLVALLAGLAGYGARPVSQALLRVTSPAEEFGARIGDDYFLATFTQLERYWKKVDAESERVQLVSIGQTEEGRAQWMAVVSAPENIARLEDYRAISRRLALGEVSLTEARSLARDGKAVVWINGGLHADEVLGAQQLIQLVYELAKADDEETLRFLRDVIVLVVHANPDGHALVADWYMREREPMQRSLEGVPRSYQKYIGHDNNRDFFLSSQAETININRVLYREWFPQIVFDHHQPGPPGTVMFAPPFGGSANPVVDALIPATLDLVGSAMQARFAGEGKRGVTTRAGANYSMWWNGGLRTSAYFHNQVGLLTETTGDPTPIDLPRVGNRLLVTPDLPLPIAPQRWHFRQAVEYLDDRKPCGARFRVPLSRDVADERLHDGEKRDGRTGRRFVAARVHPAVYAARLSDRHEVRGRAAEVGHGRASRDGGVSSQREDVSGRLPGGQDGAAVPRARPRHVRATTLPG